MYTYIYVLVTSSRLHIVKGSVFSQLTLNEMHARSTCMYMYYVIRHSREINQSTLIKKRNTNHKNALKSLSKLYLFEHTIF